MKLLKKKGEKRTFEAFVPTIQPKKLSPIFALSLCFKEALKNLLVKMQNICNLFVWLKQYAYFCICILAYVATTVQRMPHFWEAAAILELQSILWVIATISDGTCPYRWFCKLHNTITNDLNALCYKTLNLFAESRYIYFF